MKRRRVVLLLALAVLVTITSSAFADSNVRIVRLSYVQGSVLIDQGTGNGFMKATMNMPVSSSTRIRTGDTGLAEVQFEEGATLRLVGDTSVLFQPLLLTSKGMRVSGIAVGEGTVYVNVRNAKHDRFFLNVHGIPLEISKKTHLRISADQKQVLVAIFKGSMTDATSGASIGSGDSLRIDQQSNAITDIAKGIDPFASDAWDQERDRYYQNPTLYSNLATSSLVYAPTAASTTAPCFGMMPGSFGVWTGGCGYGWNQGYYGYWNPYPYAPYGPTNSLASTHPKPKPPNPHGHPQDETGMPKTAITLPVSPTYASSVRPVRGGYGISVTPQTSTGATPAATFAGSRPIMPGSPSAGPTTGARWTPVSPSRPSGPNGMGYSSVSTGARPSYSGGYSGTYSGSYSGSYSGGYSGGSTATAAPSRPSPSYSPPTAPSAPATAPMAAPVAPSRPGR